MSAVLLAAALLGAAHPVPAAPAANNQLVTDVTRCRAITDPQQRLLCFDTASAALEAATARSDVVVLDREAVRKARHQLFGFSLPTLPFLQARNDKEARADDKEARELDGVIASAQPSGYNHWQFTLVEGGTWQTTEESLSFDPAKGDKVHIKAGLLGSYAASIAGGRTVKVIRLR